jgi:hypothetical protein
VDQLEQADLEVEDQEQDQILQELQETHHPLVHRKEMLEQMEWVLQNIMLEEVEELLTAGTTPGGAGGAGSSNSITGSPVNYAGGGGGGVQSPNPPAPGGAGGGGAGGVAAVGTAGCANTGGGGGGGGYPGSAPVPSSAGGAGGSGIVIVKQYAAGTFQNAPGVWSITDAYNYKKAGQWVSTSFDVDYLVVARRWRWIWSL